MTYVLWIALVTIVVVGAFFLVRFWVLQPWTNTYQNLDDPHFVNWLKDYETWYAKSSSRCSNILVVCRITPLVIGFAVAVVSAVNKDDPFFKTYIDQSILVIILTGISSFAVAIITQLGLGDLAKTRENGRIGCAHLVARAQLMFAKSASDAIQNEKYNMMESLFRLEQQQADLFAALGHPPQQQPQDQEQEQKPPAPPPRIYQYGSRAIGPDF